MKLIPNPPIKHIHPFYSSIEIAPLLHPALEYAPLYNLTNQLLTEFRSIINRRALFNKRKAEKIDNEKSESIEVETTTQLAEPTETMLEVYTEEVNTNVIELKPQEQIRAVAMPFEIAQLRFVYDNDG